MAWYATATPCNSTRPEIIVKVRNADRKRKDYQAALRAYRQHRKTHLKGKYAK